MNKLALINSDGEIYADSRDVAAAINVEHRNLLRTIHSYCEILSESKIALAELGQHKIEQSDFFVEAEYTNSQNKKMPCYLITRKGCDMIANKLTGKKGVLFTAAYVSAFEQMKQAVEQAKINPPKATSIGDVVKLIRVTRETMKEQGCSPADVAQAVKEICEQFGVTLPKCFIKPKETTLKDVYDMIDFVFTHKNDKTPPTYEDFLVQSSILKLKE